MKCSFVLFLAITFCHTVSAQKEAFQVHGATQKVSASYYNQILLIDARADTVHMGSVHLGLMNNLYDIKFKSPFQDQLSSLILTLSDSTAQKQTLYFQLRNFYMSEQKSSFTDRGVFRFRAALYCKRDQGFVKISEADTVLLVKSGNATKSLMERAGTEIIEFVQENLRKTGNELNAYSEVELNNPDSVEKSGITLYTTQKYKDGIYLSYQSFSNQIPDKPMIVEEKNGKITRVSVADSTGAMVKIKSKNTYAMVYKGRPYIATSYDFYPLLKDNDDFYFTGKIKAGADPMPGLFLGLVGALLSDSNYSTFEMKIDHHTGGFIQIRYIPEPESL